MGRRHDVWNQHRGAGPSSARTRKNAASPAATEFLCLKKESLHGPYEGLVHRLLSTVRAVPSSRSSAPKRSPIMIPESVAAALGREKIEGIVTSSGRDHEADQGLRLHPAEKVELSSNGAARPASRDQTSISRSRSRIPNRRRLGRRRHPGHRPALLLGILG